MDRPVVLFKKKFSDTSPDLVRKLRQRIKEDVQYTSFRHFHKFTVCLPALYLFMPDFKQQYIISVCDLDMKNDLKTAKVINWCDGVKNLYPLSTTADGNCLLHAVSQGLWGIEDSDQFLRTLLYLTLSEGDASLTNGMSSKIQRRWKYAQDELKKQRPTEFNYDVTSLDISLDWNNIVQAASDVLQPGTNRAGTSYPTLEGVHIFTLANLLKRPIIVLADRTARSVYGNSMQENNLYGIYLPLEVKHSDICKTPIILGYSLNHFAPLVTQANSPEGEGSSQSILPLVMGDYTPLPLRFLLRGEEYNAVDLMKKYMYVKNIPRVSSESVSSIPGVVLQHLSIHDELDIVNVHRRECEQIFLNWGIPNSQTAVGGKAVVAASEKVPTSFTRTINPSAPQARPDPVQRAKLPISIQTGRNIQPCVTPGCTMFGSPETANMCSACFRKYTLDFNKEEAQRKGWNLPSEPSAPPMSFHGQESYTDLSVMGVNCCNPKCGNRCSEHTFPYCHACKPQAHGSDLVQPGAGASTPPNTPLIEAKCRNPKCDNLCSSRECVCHECKDFFIQQGAYKATVPVLPPATISTNTLPNTSPSGLAVAPEDQINSGMRPIGGTDISFMQDQQCQNSLQCMNRCTKSTFPYCPACSAMKREARNTISNPSNLASHVQGPPVTNHPLTPATQTVEPAVQTQGAGAEGIDENSLFGEGTTTAPIKELGKLDITPSALSVEDFEESNSLSSNFVFSHGPSSQTHVIKNFKTNNSSSEGTPSPMESGKRLSYPEAKFHQQTTIQSSGSSYAIIREETSSQESQADPSKSQGQRQSPESPELLKQLCSKPGCCGVRIANNFGYCLDCWTSCIRTTETPVLLTSESTEESRAPQLNTSEIRSMNPVVTTSKDKRDCASPLCNKKIYPPNKLCDECIEVLRQGQSRSLEEQTSPRHERKSKSYSPSRPKCKKKNCDFHGSSKTDGYCSQCYKEVKRIPIESNFKQTPTLSNLTPYNKTMAPPRTRSDPGVLHGGASYTPQVVQSGAGYTPQVVQSGAGYTPQVVQSGAGYTPQVVESGARYTPQVVESGAGYTPQMTQAGAGYTPQMTQAGAGYTPQMTQGGARHTKGDRVPLKVQNKSQFCLEPGCDRFGDPNMYYRCTEHYQMALSDFQPQPPPSNKYSAREVMNYNLAEKQPPYNMPGQPSPVHPSPLSGPPNANYMNNLSRPPTYNNPSQPACPQNTAFHSAMSTVENNLKNRVLCKTAGCTNIGSGMRRGYCSECYPHTLQRRGPDTELPADDPCMNYGCC
ncbi:uncharacterized protein LOC117327794 [Pecten maximus]|uniref:uncharacterized protein LOC117327794 n=1 Tax=Pecten maximus TaxID=6579 RepID=UPI001457ECFB|nr:uncharacterized protein LOC117327794 [Pecten maximus]XP_033740864.1 uncharacterized protein LOC117327794 [Pecten maximus]XP_033740865.1 uncharacterized protein LOC117327794 [Pecten maximus]